ncbi:TetR/AcrR family transcriptional regulator [Amycolatopsis jiangsuensis]|uniref:AcrR family transcriptional regulator n=1 Tax=Amycolatopsis jiangsuensis TaxID=1181879 RepID=A0A840IK66_9PSEU|nr:TetR/AcrR family transcriptional regulator [Amycolatopsis jiangsuensis]MBB4682711.1 AcrR family transcriptional regulator [Amycolatopsis jiangsuensis]
MTPSADGRRTGTRDRIHATALEMFTTQGYERTTLAQVADRLGITRPAVYHHFRSKEDLLTSAYDRLVPDLDALAASLRPAPAPRRTRRTALDRFATLLAGADGAVLVCARVNEHALRGLPAAAEVLTRLDELAQLLAPAQDVESRMRARLALSALTMPAARAPHLGGTEEDRHRAARDVAHDLLFGLRKS